MGGLGGSVEGSAAPLRRGGGERGGVDGCWPRPRPPPAPPLHHKGAWGQRLEQVRGCRFPPPPAVGYGEQRVGELMSTLINE